MQISDEVRRINVNLLEIAFGEYVAANRELRGQLAKMRELDTTALCLSGGGIRSATFNLGILQGLARKGILPKIDYLSTVSGGGYIGGWLSSWMRRHDEGGRAALKDLAATTTDPLEPEVKPIRHLREYSDYLAPRYGLFSADTWTLVGTYIRNLLLNWTLLLPLIAIALLVPRFYEAALLHPPQSSIPLFAVWITGVASLLGGMIVVGWRRPTRAYVPGPHLSAAQIRKGQREAYEWLLPGLVSAIAFGLVWAWLPRVAASDPQTFPMMPASFRMLVEQIGSVLLIVNGISTLVFLGRYAVDFVRIDGKGTWLDTLKRMASALRSRTLDRGLTELRARIDHEVLGGMVATGAATILLAATAWYFLEPQKCLPWIDRPEWLTLFAVPIVLFVFFIEATLLVGIITPVSFDHEREWWARSASWLFTTSLIWIGVGAAAIIAPLLILQLPRITASIGGVAGLVTIILGRSSKTPALAKGEKTRSQQFARATMGVTATLFLAVVLGAVSLGITKATERFADKPFAAPVEGGAPAPLLVTQTRNGVTTRYEIAPKAESGPLAATRGSMWQLHMVRWMNPVYLAALLAGLAGIVFIAAKHLDANTYSMHGMYRDRLIRAYLGASRWFRRPDPFTGFDPQDDLKMFELRPEMLWLSSFHDFNKFLGRLRQPNDLLWPRLEPALQNKIRDYCESTAEERKKVLHDLAGDVLQGANRVMLTFDLRRNVRATTSLRLLLRNSRIVRRFYRDCLRSRKRDSNLIPMHIINTTLNVVSGEKLAWRDRKAASFTITPLHAGNRWLEYRDSAEYANGVSLGTAMAISGAAVSPNRGYSSSPVITFLLTLFNARLGWWLGNPGVKGHETYRDSGPRNTLKALVNEAAGRTNDESEYVFLSDGGHFENLGLYEAVLRRCRQIIVCDATQDQSYAFGDLANAVRKIRIDLGIPIEFTTMYIGPAKGRDDVGKYCAFGTIYYSRVDAPSGHDAFDLEMDGRLIYIKPSVYRDCPTDVLNYKKESTLFPHETTVDQFFSETQFESYRALGSHVIDQICAHRAPADLQTNHFFEAANAYLNDAMAQRFEAAATLPPA